MTMSQINNHDGYTPSIRNCIWGFKCDNAWDKLTQTDLDAVRFCGHCQKEVYLCDDDESVVYSVVRNRCIAINVQSFTGSFKHGGSSLLGNISIELEER